MAGISLHRTGEILRILFDVLREHPEGVKASEAIESTKKRMVLTDYEKGFYETGSLRFDKNLRFASIDTVKAGWLIKNKGVWTITDEGIKAHDTIKNPEQFYREAQKLYREWRRASRPEKSETVEAEKSFEASITFERAEEQAWKDIEEYLTKMPPYDFQNLVAALLQAMGYHVSWIAPAGKDGGVDIIAWNDPLGTKPPRIKVQVKREQGTTSVTTLRSFISQLGNDDVGLFVSTGGFTKDAEDTARNHQVKQITLINLQKLYEMWVKHYDRLSEDAKDLFPLKPIYFLSPST